METDCFHTLLGPGENGSNKIKKMINYKANVNVRDSKKTILDRLVACFNNTISDFCMETSIHGFNHIAVKNRYWFERILWLLVTALSVYMVLNISLDQWQRYNENPTVVTLEKDFRNWKFPLPSITECASDRTDPLKAKQVINKLWNIDSADEKFDYYMKFVKTVANSDLRHLDGFLDFSKDPTLDVDLYEIALGVMPDQIVKPTWVQNMNPEWLPVMTESGVCYTTNSVAIADIIIRNSDKNETRNFPLNCVYASHSCYVTLEIMNCVKFYFNSPYDVMDTGVPVKELCPLLNRNIALTVMQSVCGPGVRDLTVPRRRCLYTDEPIDKNLEVYSTNMCRRSCRNKLALDLCGCKPFYNNFYAEGKTCSPAGMACLAKHSVLFATTSCSCIPQCIDAVYQEVSFDEAKWDRGLFANRGSVRINLQTPRERYTRQIVFHFQDLVVSFGGAAGFFLGASFLSFVEIFYFIIERGICCWYLRKPKTLDGTNMKEMPSHSYEEMRIRELTNYIDEDWNKNYY